MIRIFCSVHEFHLQDPILLGLKKKGDKKFQAQLYQEAAEVYTFITINYPFMDTVIAEKLFHKRAVCFYEMVSFNYLFNSTRYVTDIAPEQSRRLLISCS